MQTIRHMRTLKSVRPEPEDEKAKLIAWIIFGACAAIITGYSVVMFIGQIAG